MIYNRPRSRPTRYASEAAIAPTNSVMRPEYHHDEVDHLLFIEPMAKKTMPVSTIEIVSEPPVPNKNGNSGTRPQIKNAVNVLNAAIHGERTA